MYPTAAQVQKCLPKNLAMVAKMFGILVYLEHPFI